MVLPRFFALFGLACTLSAAPTVSVVVPCGTDRPAARWSTTQRHPWQTGAATTRRARQIQSALNQARATTSQAPTTPSRQLAPLVNRPAATTRATRGLHR